MALHALALGATAPIRPDAWTTVFHFDMYFTKLEQGNLDRDRDRHRGLYLDS